MTAGDAGLSNEEGDEQSHPLHARIGRAVLPHRIRRSYAAKFALALVVVILLITAVGIVSQMQIRTIIQDDAENTLESTATLQADSVSEWVASMGSQARGLAAADVYANGDRDEIRPYLVESQSLTSTDVVDLHYVDPETGQIVASTNSDFEFRTVEDVNPAWREPIGEAATENATAPALGVSDTAYERGGRLAMAFAIEVRNADGVLVVVGDVRNDFEQLHRTRNIVTTQVLNPSGQNVFSARRSQQSVLTDTEEFRAAMDGEVTVRQRESDVLAFAPVRNTDWVVVTVAPNTELYEASRTVGRNVIVLVATSVVTLAVVGFVLGRGTIVPLVRLRRRAEEMERGNLDVDLETHREDEIGRLFVAFENMRDALREQIQAANAAREAAERSRREVERQNQRLDQFASTVSHDLRNPLTIAGGHTEMLRKKLDEADDETVEEFRSHVEKIDGSHDRIEAIIEDVLTLTREGEDIEETEFVDLETIARDAWANVETSDATLTVAETDSFEADPDRLLRVFENLFRNAVEHGSTGSRPQADDAVEHGSDGDGVTVTVGRTDGGFYVADDGPGIPESEREEIFEYGHTTDEDGTGLGLAIVETIVGAHGWTIDVAESEAGGAKFVVGNVFGPAEE
jgi:signal transduction histidine kinase